MGNVTLFYIFTLLYLITTPLKNHTRVFQSLALSLRGWTWALWALAFLGLGLGLGLGLIFILCLLLILRRLEGRTSNMRVDVLFLH